MVKLEQDANAALGILMAGGNNRSLIHLSDFTLVRFRRQAC